MKKKEWLVLLIVILLVGGGGFGISYALQKQSTPAPVASVTLSPTPSPAVATSSSPTASPTVTPSSTPAATPVPYPTVSGKTLLLAEEGSDYKSFPLQSYSLASGKTDKVSFSYVHNFSQVSNQNFPAIQWSTDGKVMAYSSATEGGMGPDPIPNDYSLKLRKSDGSLVNVFESYPESKISLWKLTPDGKNILYIKHETSDYENEKAPQSLYIYTIASGAHEKLSSEDVSAYLGSTRDSYYNPVKQELILVRDENKSISMYTFSLVSKKGVDKKVYGITGITSFIETVTENTLSPDGKWLAQRLVSTSDPTSFDLRLIDVEKGTLGEVLYNAGRNRSINGFNWSPDSTSIAFETTTFGIDRSDGEKVEMNIVNVKTKKQTNVTSVTFSTAVHELGPVVHDWSPDGKYIAFNIGSSVFTYDVESQKSPKAFTANTFYGDSMYLAWAGF